jgi:hypothetical protein
MEEREEQRIVELVTRAALRNDEASWTELWTAARWLHRLSAEDRAAMTATILESDPRVAAVWATFLLEALERMERQHESIADGEAFEHDGETYRAARV